MANNKPLPHPTDGELAILRVLWERGASTVRQVNDLLSEDRATGYTTTAKIMQIMTDKRLIARDDSKWPHVYSARLEEAPAQNQILHRVLDRAFGGSTEKLLMRLLSAGKVSPQELARIRRMLEDAEKDRS